MKKFTVSSLLLIIILGLIAIFYFDLLGLSKSKEATLASIIAAEDTRRVTGKFDDYINDPDPDIRARAALAIGRIGVVSRPTCSMSAPISNLNCWPCVFVPSDFYPTPA